MIKDEEHNQVETLLMVKHKSQLDIMTKEELIKQLRDKVAEQQNRTAVVNSQMSGIEEELRRVSKVLQEKEE